MYFSSQLETYLNLLDGFSNPPLPNYCVFTVGSKLGVWSPNHQYIWACVNMALAVRYETKCFQSNPEIVYLCCENKGLTTKF